MMQVIKAFLQSMKSHGMAINHHYMDFGVPDITPHVQHAVQAVIRN